MIAPGAGLQLRFLDRTPPPGAPRLASTRHQQRVAPFPSHASASCLVILVCALIARPAGAQSLAAGSLLGTVRSEAGLKLGEADVTLNDDVTGARRSRLTPRDGAFAFDLLLPGEYSVLVERFGFRPTLVRAVPVRAGAQVQLDIVLKAGEAGGGIDTVAFPGVPAGGPHLALHGGGSTDDFGALADQRQLPTGVASLLPGADGELGAEGLPGRLGAVAADGLTRWSPRHPRLAAADLDAIAFPMAALRGLSILPGGTDAEWPGAGGGLLSATTIPGARNVSAGLTLSGGPDGQAGSAVLSGPIVRDTANFTLGIAAVRLNPELPSPWQADSAGPAAANTIAQDSFATDLSRYRRPYKPATMIVSGFGRLDWSLARDHRLNVRASAASATIDDPDLGPDQPPALGARLTARDLSVAALLTSVISVRFGNELRLSLDAGNRDYTAAPLAGTVFADGGFAAGTTALQPGTFKRTTFRIGETGHLRFRFGGLKFGVQGIFSTFDQTFADGRAGTYYFGDTTGFASRTGVFRQTVGTLPTASFKTTALGFFAQLRLAPSPGLEILLGARRDAETVPVSQIRLNSEWLRLTGIDNRTVPKQRAQISPRLTLTWTLGATRRWQVEAEAAQFAEATDPGEFAEALVHATGTRVRRGNGALGAWPGVPDSTVAPVQGEALTLLGPQYTPPRTGRVRLGLTGNLGGALMHLQGSYRHADYLPVRRDLNLRPDPRSRDQYGRPLYGTLTQFGTVLAATPGSNRRFAGFDEVISIDPSAYSDYWGLSLGIEGRVKRSLSLMVTYTYSHTTDDWFGARLAAGLPQPFADTSGWTKGRSDFDVPHRLVVGAEAHLGARARLAALYRWHSGYPFTPGFRDGVDANGDGSARNDPAFVIDTVAGAASVIAANACLGSQVGHLAERNSCRDPAAGELDLRLAIVVAHLGGAATELTFDAFGLARSGADVMDHALYLVDRTRALTTNALTGVTSVPLVANPDFGQMLIKTDPGVAFRVGLRVGF